MSDWLIVIAENRTTAIKNICIFPMHKETLGVGVSGIGEKIAEQRHL